MANSVKNFLIGLFLLAGIGIFASLVLFLRPSVGDEKQTLYVRFSNVNKINIGTRVLFAGKAVGEVTAVNEIFHARETQPSDELGRLYFYQLTLKIDSRVHVYSTDEVSIQTSGLLGEKSIAIIPKTPAKGISPEMITDKTPFYADSIDPLENAFNQFSDIGEKLNDTVDLVKAWFEKNEINLSQTIASVDKICQDLALGQGTLGRLIQGGDMYMRLSAVMSKADTMMNDINHYGILFHLNKGWQRTRTKQLSALNALNTPHSFKDYFETEIDQINTAMARISMLIDKAERDDQAQILETPQFKENFAELLRKVKEMSDNLHLYNEQLAEALQN